MSEKEGLLRAKELYKKNFHDEPQKAFVSYGRLEIIGNHTDHQHGHCIVAGCSLGIKGAVSPTQRWPRLDRERRLWPFCFPL
jgi:galactokinase